MKKRDGTLPHGPEPRRLSGKPLGLMRPKQPLTAGDVGGVTLLAVGRGAKRPRDGVARDRFALSGASPYERGFRWGSGGQAQFPQFLRRGDTVLVPAANFVKPGQHSVQLDDAPLRRAFGQGFVQHAVGQGVVVGP